MEMLAGPIKMCTELRKTWTKGKKNPGFVLCKSE
jgi:hypothetical protein